MCESDMYVFLRIFFLLNGHLLLVPEDSINHVFSMSILVLPVTTAAQSMYYFYSRDFRLSDYLYRLNFPQPRLLLNLSRL